MEFGLIPSEPLPGPLAEAALRSDYQPRVPHVLAPDSFAGRARYISSGRRSRRTPGRGRLWITPEGVSFAESAGTRQFVHGSPDVVLVRARLRPPLANTFLILRAGRARLRVTVSGLNRRRLRRALRQTGLTVVDVTRWTAPVSATSARPSGGRRARR